MGGINENVNCWHHLQSSLVCLQILRQAPSLSASSTTATRRTVFRQHLFLSSFFFTKDLVQLRSSCSSNMRTQTHTKQKRRNKYKKKNKKTEEVGSKTFLVFASISSHLHISAVLSYFFSLCFFFPFIFFLVFLLYFAFSTAPIVLHVYVQARSRVLKQKTREKGRNFKRTSKNRPVLGYRLVSFFFCFLL